MLTPAALERGSYGLWEDCSGEITEERLQLTPYAICCVTGQQQPEGPEKHNRHY